MKYYGDSKSLRRSIYRGPPTIYRHHKGLRIKKGISKGVVYELSEPKRTAKCIPPPGLHWRSSSFRKILVSVKFVSAILGPEMGAPILWTPGKNAFFLQEKPMSVKFPFFGGGFGGGGGECRFYFYGRADFSESWLLWGWCADCGVRSIFSMAGSFG